LDPLTQTIRLLRPKALTWKQGRPSGAWALRFPAHAGAAFCLIAEGRCRLVIEGHEPRQLGEGDYLLLVAPPCWSLRNGEPTAALDFDAAEAGPDPDQSVDGGSARKPSTGAVTRLIGGHFSFDDANAGLLTTLVPNLVQIRASEPSAGRLRGVLALIDDEASSDRPGRSLVLERLLEIMLVEAIRHHHGGFGGVHAGLLAGLGDQKIAAALRALHADVRRAWTVQQLAEIAGASRSVFAQHFTRLVGVPPIDYLTHWRMALAKDALRSGAGRLDEIAFACGYQSASAFSTAFSRVVGCPPTKYAALPTTPAEPGHRNSVAPVNARLPAQNPVSTEPAARRPPWRARRR
jgi:AraC-like DNA-binding protein